MRYFSISQEVADRSGSVVTSGIGAEIEVAIKDAVLKAINSEVASLDLTSRVRIEVQETFERTIQDQVRRQIRDIVRLAVHKELEATRIQIKEDEANG